VPSPVKTSYKQTPSQLPTYQTFASTLAQKSHPTLLYTAPSHTFYTFTSYTAAAFCFTYAAYNFNAHYLHPPPDLLPWVPVAFGGVCFLVACFGGWLLLAPARLIKTITVLPSSAQALAAAKKNGAAMQQGPGGLRLEIELRKMFPLPFFPARKITANPEDVMLSSRLFHPLEDTRQSAAERLEMRRRLEREQEEERRKSILTAPFRDGKRAFGQLFRAMARTWSREGFLKLAVKGQAYKLDVTGGWALDEGKALDRLLKVKL
jgi:hypothetical protein